jgi:hypothetical protein
MGEFHCDFPPFPGRKNDEKMTNKLEKRIQHKNKTMGYVMVCTYYILLCTLCTISKITFWLWQPHNLLNNSHDFGCFLLVLLASTTKWWLLGDCIYSWVNPTFFNFMDGWFPKMGVPLFSIDFVWDFPWNQPAPNGQISRPPFAGVWGCVDASLLPCEQRPRRSPNASTICWGWYKLIISCNRDIFMGYNNNGI